MTTLPLQGKLSGILTAVPDSTNSLLANQRQIELEISAVTQCILQKRKTCVAIPGNECEVYITTYPELTEEDLAKKLK